MRVTGAPIWEQPNPRLKLAGAEDWGSVQSNPPVPHQWNVDLLLVARSLSAIR